MASATKNRSDFVKMLSADEIGKYQLTDRSTMQGVGDGLKLSKNNDSFLAYLILVTAALRPKAGKYARFDEQNDAQWLFAKTMKWFGKAERSGCWSRKGFLDRISKGDEESRDFWINMIRQSRMGVSWFS